MPLIHCLLSSRVQPSLAQSAITTLTMPQHTTTIQYTMLNHTTRPAQPSHNWDTDWRHCDDKSCILSNADNDGLRPLSCITGQREGRAVCRDRSECQGSDALQLLQLRNNVKCARTPYLIHWHPQFTVAASKQCRILCRQSCGPSLL